MDLTIKERISYFNQYRILGALYPDRADDYEQMCEILQNGHTLEYGRLEEHFSPEVSRQDCEEVVEILEMFRSLHNAIRQMEDTSAIEIKACQFQGFDGNEETDQYGYAKFLIEDQGRWAESKRTDLKTHSPVLGRYRRMLRSWKASADAHNLSKEDVLRITAGRSA